MDQAKKKDWRLSSVKITIIQQAGDKLVSDIPLSIP